MTPRALTARQAVVLQYVCEHPGCTTTAVAGHFALSHTEARDALIGLHYQRFVARQRPFRGVPVPTTWLPEQKALDAYETARASLEEAQP